MTLENATLANISFSDTQIKIKRGTAADWAAANPILEAGELGYITDSNLLKVGDGTTAFNSLGGGVGLTEAEVTTLIGRGEANGTAGLSATKNLLIPSNIIYLRTSGVSGSCNLYSGNERVFEAYRVKANDYRLRMNTNNTLVELLAASDRNGATDTAVAAIYNPCKTIFNEHRPVCTKEYHLTGKYLDGADNPDVWFPIPGAGGGTVVYSTRFLTITSGTGATSASRCVIDQTKFPIAGNFAEVTCRIGVNVNGVGGTKRYVSFGFQPDFSTFYGNGTDRATFIRSSSGAWWVGAKETNIQLTDLPLGRNLAPGDICTVRLDRQEGSANIDIARFYVNGQKQYETVNIPTVDCYAGIGVFTDADTTTATSIAIDYFGVRYSPGSGGEAIQNIEVINEPEETGEVINEPEETGEVVDEPEVTGEVID